MARTKPSIPIQSLQGIDRILGWGACALVQPWRWLRRLRRRPAAPDVERLLLIKFWGIGSLQLLTPTLEVLRNRHQGASITLLTLRDNEGFARGLGVFDEIHSFDAKSSSWVTMGRRIFGLVMALRRARFDCVYDFEFFTRFSALVSFLTGAPRTTGFSAASTWRGGLHSDNITFNRYWHVARNFRALAGGETGENVPVQELVPYRVSVSDEQRLGELLESKNIPRNAYLVLNPNAGRLSLERRWARNHFAELSEQIHENTDLHVILIGSPSEREYTAGLGQLTKHLPRLHDFAGKLSIGELCALLRGARAVITNDSGPMHLSAALGAPTLGLFGPETPLMYEPMGSQAQYIYKPTICSPCINVHQGKVATCIHSRPECLENISAVEVWDWLRSALNNKGSQAPAALRVLDA